MAKVVDVTRVRVFWDASRAIGSGYSKVHAFTPCFLVSGVSLARLLWDNVFYNVAASSLRAGDKFDSCRAG
ncbi:hypothetical protein [Microvirga vignae]|uniref:hypothetical protein n=1 Tax=Microvirga vignae TaxID=1225564 RepID=UPI000AF833A9|nr:hypothetical protein [Microvirga vignae]